jgi:hypothetical protein
LRQQRGDGASTPVRLIHQAAFSLHRADSSRALLLRIKLRIEASRCQSLTFFYRVDQGTPSGSDQILLEDEEMRKISSRFFGLYQAGRAYADVAPIRGRGQPNLSGLESEM